MISIFDYQQYREFLKDYYQEQKERRTGFTYARFSSHAGIASPNYFKLVMDGQKNLTSENMVRFASSMKLGTAESDYFEALVHFNQARRPLERDYYFERVQRLKKRYKNGSLGERALEQDEFDTVTSWVYFAVMVLTNIKYFRESPQWIRERLFGLLTEKEVAAVLEKLEATRLIARGADGRLRQTSRQVKTKPELRKLASKLFYESLLKRAMQALDLTDPDEREFGAFLVGLSPKQVPELKRRVRTFLAEINEWALENPSPHQVYALSFAGFPVTSIEGRHCQ